ncbi:MAG: 4Fe-4S dicluster domain-containing protein [Bacteroidota bacterium]
MGILSQVIFALILGVGSWIFDGRVKFIRRNIFLGKEQDLSDNPSARWKQMLWVAMGQSKMVKRPVAGFFHILIYVGFVLINIEVLEILIDGLLGTHRFFAHYLGSIYDVAIGFFEVLAFGVVVACVVFLARRFVTKVPRLQMNELKGWPMKDATIILVVEIVLMGALLMMNAAEQVLVNKELMEGHGSFPVSQYLVGFFSGFSDGSVHMIERLCWWFHFVGIVVFLNYVPYSKHWHIIMSFPNVYYTPLKPKGSFENLDYVTTEVKLMMDPAAQPPDGYEPPAGFGAKDVQDLTWKNLMDAYTCTECGRCSSVCPANQTGKLLSPRKVMMDTRDRLEEVGRGIDAAKKAGTPVEGRFEDGKDLHSYVSAEELWACTTCNACAEACPVNINPVDIIVQMRQYQVMEKSAAPSELNNMFTNLENNGAPWQFNQMDKANWTQG